MHERPAPTPAVAQQSERPDTPPAEASDRPVLSLDELEALYPNEWVLIEVTARDQLRRPTHGRVIAHDPSREKMRSLWASMLDPEETWENPLYLMVTDRGEGSGDDFRVLLDQLRYQLAYLEALDWARS